MGMPSITSTGIEASTSTSGFEGSVCIDVIDNVENLASSHELAVIPPPTSHALAEIIDFHLKGEGHTRLSEELLKQLALSMIAGLGATLYGPPASNFSYSECIDYPAIPCSFFLMSYVAGTCVTSAIVLHNSTIEFFDRQKAAGIPLKLAKYLQDPLSSKQRALKNIGITAGSFISSIPFVVINLANPIPALPVVFIIPLASIIAFTNTLLHLLPFELVSQIPFYRAPLLPIEFIIRQLVNSRLTAEEQQEKKLQAEINHGYQKIKQQLINHLEQGKKLLTKYGFRFEGCGYINNAAQEIKALHEREQSPVELLQALLNYLHAISPGRPISQPGRINKILRAITYAPGAFLVMSSCAGFLASPVNELTTLTGSKVAGATLAAPSVYFLGVLLAFFGGNALQNTYDYFTAWKDDSVKVPMAFKLYPKTSVLLIIISIYLSAFSYAAGAQLINDNFNGKLAFLRPYLLDLAQTGLSFLGFTAMMDYFNNILTKFGQYGGSEETQRVIDLTLAFSQMQNSIQRMLPQELLDSLAKMDDEQLKAYLNLQNNADKGAFIQTFCQLKMALEEKLPNAEYLSVCKIILNLEKINVVDENESDDLTTRHSLNNDASSSNESDDLTTRHSLNNDASSSTERTRLIPRDTTRGRSIFSRFYRPAASDVRESSVSPAFVNSNHMEI
jgi:hypothetical protein